MFRRARGRRRALRMSHSPAVPAYRNRPVKKAGPNCACPLPSSSAESRLLPQNGPGAFCRRANASFPPALKTRYCSSGLRDLVPTGRFELPHLAALAPQASVSTNSTTSAMHPFCIELRARAEATSSVQPAPREPEPLQAAPDPSDSMSYRQALAQTPQAPRWSRRPAGRSSAREWPAEPKGSAEPVCCQARYPCFPVPSAARPLLHREAPSAARWRLSSRRTRVSDY